MQKFIHNCLNKNFLQINSYYKSQEKETEVRIRKIYKNLFLLAIVICSYIALLFYMSHEGFKGISRYTGNKSSEEEMIRQTISIQKANFEDIQINKSLIDLQ